MTQQGVEVFSHDVSAYHTFRIEPPDVIADIAEATLGHAPRIVVDLGCGTGLSTRLWVHRANEVIGIEPNHEMRAAAEKFLATGDWKATVRVIEGRGDETGIEDNYVDVVACSQSLHWMDPERTHPEITRILCPGGILVAFGYDMPPTSRPEFETAYNEVLSRANSIIRTRALWPDLKVWPFRDQLPVLKSKHWYRYVKEAFCHQHLTQTAEWLVGLAKNYGSIARAISRGVTEEELGIPLLLKVVKENLGESAVPLVFHYKMIVAVK